MKNLYKKEQRAVNTSGNFYFWDSALIDLIPIMKLRAIVNKYILLGDIKLTDC